MIWSQYLQRLAYPIEKHFLLILSLTVTTIDTNHSYIHILTHITHTHSHSRAHTHTHTHTHTRAHTHAHAHHTHTHTHTHTCMHAFIHVYENCWAGQSSPVQSSSLVHWLDTAMHLQFMYFQYNVYLSIVVHTNIIHVYIYIYIKHAPDPKRTPSWWALPASWGVKLMGHHKQ